MDTDTKAPETIEEAYNPEGAKRIKWAEFVETSVIDFFQGFKLEKLSVEDGNGNKAKLSRTKDSGIKVEHSSVTIM